MPKQIQKDIFKKNPEVIKEWDPILGDRMIKLVFIGKGMDRAQIEAELDSLLDN